MARLVTTTYGDALLELVKSENKVDKVFEEICEVQKIIADNQDLMDFLNHPNIDKNEKIAAVENIFGKAFSKDVTGFLVTIVSKERTKEIPDILDYFIKDVEEYKGIGTAYVTTPSELTQAMKDKIVQKLLATTKYKEFKMNWQVDESLIGGMVIRIGDRVVDSSVKTQLDKLSRQLYGVDIA